MDIKFGKSPEAQDFDHVLIGGGNLEISFHRTVRVTDNRNVSDMPPTFGRFPLLPVNSFKRVPSGVAEKGGMMIPMYRES